MLPKSAALMLELLLQSEAAAFAVAFVEDVLDERSWYCTTDVTNLWFGLVQPLSTNVQSREQPLPDVANNDDSKL